MNLFLLKTAEVPEVPANVTVVQNYGRGGVVDNKGGRHWGEELLLQAEPQAFVEWLKEVPGVWLCSNPMLGDWAIHHIKESVK